MDRVSTRDCAINTIKTTQQSLWGQVPNISPSSGKASEKTVGGQGSQAIVYAYQWYPGSRESNPGAGGGWVLGIPLTLSIRSTAWFQMALKKSKNP